METITKEYKVYEFDELSEDIKRKLIEQEKDNQNEFYCETYLEEDMNMSAENLLIDTFGNAEWNYTYYDLSYSQGSGAMIGFSINIEDLNEKYNFLSKEELRLIQDKGLINDIEIYHNSNHYYHEYTFGIRYDDNFGYYDYEDIKDEYNISEEDYKKLEDKITDLLDDYDKHYTKSPFVKDIIEMNCKLTKIGYENVEYRISDEEAIGFLKEYKYLENGTIFKMKLEMNYYI